MNITSKYPDSPPFCKGGSLVIFGRINGLVHRRSPDSTASDHSSRPQGGGLITGYLSEETMTSQNAGFAGLP